jgi:hypothetical protein
MAISGAVLIGGILAVGIGVAFSQFGKSPKDEADKLAAETDNVGDQQDAAMEALNAAQNELDRCKAEGLSGAALQECAANWDTAADNLVAVIEQGTEKINKGINALIVASDERKESVDVSLDGAESEAEIQEITDKEAAALVDDLAALRAADMRLNLLDRPLVVKEGQIVRSTVYRAEAGQQVNLPKTQAQLFPGQVPGLFPDQNLYLAVEGTGDLEELLEREKEYYASLLFDDLTDLRKLQELAVHSSMNQIHDLVGIRYTLRVANAIMAIQQSGVALPNDWEDEGTPRQTAAHTAAVILSQRADWKGYEEHIFAIESGWDDED